MAYHLRIETLANSVNSKTPSIAQDKKIKKSKKKFDKPNLTCYNISKNKNEVIFVKNKNPDFE